MKKSSSLFSQFTALVLAVVFTAAACSNPSNPSDTPVVITPGEGNVRYVYLNNSGGTSDVDQGITGLFVENNKNAKGVALVSDTRGTDDGVTLHNPGNNSTVTVFFKKSAHFPYKMEIHQGNETWLAWLSLYRTSTEKYDVTLQKEGQFYTLNDLVFNKNIFSYHADAALSADQQKRIENITVALGLMGSIGASLEEKMPGPPVVLGRWSFGSFLGSVFNPVRHIFTAAAVIAAVTAFVVAPVIAIVSPGTALQFAQTELYVAKVFLNYGTGFIDFSDMFAGSASTPPELSVINVWNIYENSWIANGEEFHIGRGQELFLNFSSPSYNHNDPNLTLGNLLRKYDPGALPGASSTNDFFFPGKIP